ncbi:hypothetical protein OS493_007323 [Desmophyllum pertusum]|uniref:Uncharacterized protein n=1 Tax=Desmophyllum pertusum TaxID=174260 RepID=A0A9W9Z6G8_9CNID|nr:hypothetical protein OS493_007323 [Desmophyllum pertusum]
MPSYIKEVPYSPVCEMDFTSAKKKRTQLVERGIMPQAQRVIGTAGAAVATPTSKEKEDFYKLLAKGKQKPAVLSLISEQNTPFVPQQSSANLPKPLT